MRGKRWPCGSSRTGPDPGETGCQGLGGSQGLGVADDKGGEVVFSSCSLADVWRMRMFLWCGRGLPRRKHHALAHTPTHTHNCPPDAGPSPPLLHAHRPIASPPFEPLSTSTSTPSQSALSWSGEKETVHQPSFPHFCIFIFFFNFFFSLPRLLHAVEEVLVPLALVIPLAPTTYEWPAEPRPACLPARVFRPR